MTSEIFSYIADARRESVERIAQQRLGQLVQEDHYVGEVFSLGYETALVQIHDFDRQRVGGIPSLSFLIATRLTPGEPFDYTAEDSSVVLLRVMDGAPLPNEADALRVRVETAQRVSGERGMHWDAPSAMDSPTHQLLSFAGIKCRVIGTFYLALPHDSETDDDVVLKFGSDISNYYPNRGLKVYRPNGAVLSKIVNYRDHERIDRLAHHTVTVGEIRYASTDRPFQGLSGISVDVAPADLLGQKTALFGMTRTGKSNTTKVILKAVFNLRYDDEDPLRVGQIVFDPNGEYANENEQDKNGNREPSAIKNVWTSHTQGVAEDVVTYGIMKHPKDPNRKLMMLNFFEEENLQKGKEIINAALAEDGSKYIQNFIQVYFESPAATDTSATKRYQRRVLVYRALLARAGFDVPRHTVPQPRGLFRKELLTALSEGANETGNTEYLSAARILSSSAPSWAQLADASRILYEFMMDGKSGYKKFDEWYINRKDGSGDPWADEDLKKLLEMFRYSNGVRQIGTVRNQHTSSTTTDYADDIYEDLRKGRLVIVDQSSGEPEVNQSSAERIMWKIFRGNQHAFRTGQTPLDITVYIEEAHNLLPEGSDDDLTDVWVRTAKEGAKYHIGMVYATQEVSSIQRNILKNTANWFIGHLNNTDETRELCKYYDFADFESSIRRAQDRGFLRVKTLSNKFVIPVMIQKFEV